MAMLAERRRKSKWVVNPRKKPLWFADEDGSGLALGKEIMEKMGWSIGKGLGAAEQGMKEPLRPQYKNDSKGMGFKGNDEDWMYNQDEYNSLLQDLTGKECDSKPNELQVENDKIHSLEEKSKKSKVRVHYKKFTRGKDISRYSKDDLACILGTGLKKKSDETTDECNDSVNETNQHGVVTINGGSYTDYFKLKMEKILRKKSATSSCEAEESMNGEEEVDSQSTELVNGNGYINCPKETYGKVKSQKRKYESKSNYDESFPQNDTQFKEFEPVISSNKIVKKKKKDRKNEEEMEVNQVDMNIETQEILTNGSDRIQENGENELSVHHHKKNKKKKKNKEKSDIIDTGDSNLYLEGTETVHKKNEKKKKKRNSEFVHEENLIESELPIEKESDELESRHKELLSQRTNTGVEVNSIDAKVIDSANNSMIYKKKSKKSSRQCEVEKSEVTSDEAEISDKGKSKHKDRCTEEVNCENNENVLDGVQEIQNDSVVLKKRKGKRKEEVYNKQGNENEDENEKEVASRKKKRKEGQHSEVANVDCSKKIPHAELCNDVRIDTLVESGEIKKKSKKHKSKKKDRESKNNENLDFQKTSEVKEEGSNNHEEEICKSRLSDPVSEECKDKKSKKEKKKKKDKEREEEKQETELSNETTKEAKKKSKKKAMVYDGPDEGIVQATSQDTVNEDEILEPTVHKKGKRKSKNQAKEEVSSLANEETKNLQEDIKPEKLSDATVEETTKVRVSYQGEESNEPLQNKINKLGTEFDDEAAHTASCSKYNKLLSLVCGAQIEKFKGSNLSSIPGYGIVRSST